MRMSPLERVAQHKKMLSIIKNRALGKDPIVHTSNPSPTEMRIIGLKRTLRLLKEAKAKLIYYYDTGESIPNIHIQVRKLDYEIEETKKAIKHERRSLNERNPFLADFGTAATLGAGFTVGSAVAGLLARELKVKNPRWIRTTYRKIYKSRKQAEKKASKVDGIVIEERYGGFSIESKDKKCFWSNFGWEKKSSFNPNGAYRIFDWAESRFKRK